MYQLLIESFGKTGNPKRFGKLLYINHLASANCRFRCPGRCGRYWWQNPSFASLTSSLPLSAVPPDKLVCPSPRPPAGPSRQAGTCFTPYSPPGDICPYGVQPRAATGFATNTSPPLIGQRNAQNRPKTCESLPKRATKCTKPAQNV